jgi:hypothetical protein
MLADKLLSENQDERKILLVGNYYKAYIGVFLGRYKKSEAIFKEVIIEARNQKDVYNEVRGRLGFAVLNRHQRNYAEALHQNQIALSLNLTTAIPIILNNISVLFLDLGNIEKAQKYMQLTSNFLSFNPNMLPELQVLIKINLSRILTDKKEFDKAEELLMVCFKESRRTMCIGNTLLSCIMLVRLYNKTKRYSRANVYLKRGLVLNENFKFTSFENGLFFENIEYLIKKKEIGESGRYLKRLERSTPEYSLKLKVKTFKKLILYYAKIGDLKNTSRLKNKVAFLSEQQRRNERRRNEQEKFTAAYEILEKEIEVRSAQQLAEEIKTQYIQLKEKEEQEVENLRTRLMQVQLNPHFVFNSLNSISALIKLNKNEEANKYILSYSRLLRKVFDLRDKQLISLSEEVEISKFYVAIEAFRFGGNIKSVFSLKVKRVGKNFLVPPLLLQPIIENAFKHGFKEGRPDYKPKLFVKIVEKESYLHVEVMNNGPGEKPVLADNVIHNGGLSITQKRLLHFNYNLISDSQIRIRTKKIYKLKEIFTVIDFKLRVKTK